MDTDRFQSIGLALVQEQTKLEHEIGTVLHFFVLCELVLIFLPGVGDQRRALNLQLVCPRGDEDSSGERRQNNSRKDEGGNTESHILYRFTKVHVEDGRSIGNPGGSGGGGNRCR